VSGSDGAGFLSRWSRRKTRVRGGQPVPEPSPPVIDPASTPLPASPTAPTPMPSTVTAGPVAAADPAPQLGDVARLTHDADFRPFVARDVDPQVRNAALKKLFTDPQFNVMDGLDVYIDDYGKPDPLPASMLRQMVQAHALGLFDDEPDASARPSEAVAASGADPDGATLPGAAQSAPEPLSSDILHDDDAAVRLQPDDAAGPAGAAGGAGEDAGRQR